jgi:hypothetical protein
VAAVARRARRQLMTQYATAYPSASPSTTCQGRSFLSTRSGMTT